MSRIGKKEILIPTGTEISVASGEITVKGKGGTLKRLVHPAITVAVEGKEVKVTPANQSRLAQALWGTYAAHVRNMLAGVNKPFEKKLQIEGIGYRAELTGKTLKLSVAGADKEVVGQFAASVRAIKKPEPYKGKGIRYEGEKVREKQGKKVAG